MTAFVWMLAGAIAVLALIWFLSRRAGFPAQKPEDYIGKGPDFDLRQHLNGPILCEGVIYGLNGQVTSRFVAEMHATWDGDRGTLTEAFRYDDGTTQDRRWTLILGDDGKFHAEAPDLVGVGDGHQAGPAVLLKYRIKLPESAGGYVLDATDWMYRVENGAIINRSQFRKYGIKVAELVATMRSVEPQGEPAE